MASATGAPAQAPIIKIPDDGFCLYNAMLEAFVGVGPRYAPNFVPTQENGIPKLPDPTRTDHASIMTLVKRQMQSRQLAFILGQIIKSKLDNSANLIDGTLTTLREKLRVEFSDYISNRSSAHGQAEKAYIIEEVENDVSADCIFKNQEDRAHGRCRKFITDIEEYLDRLSDISGDNAVIWGDIMLLRYAFPEFSDIYLNETGIKITYTYADSSGQDLSAHVAPLTSNPLGPAGVIPINIKLLHNGRHYDAKIVMEGFRSQLNPICVWYNTTDLSSAKLLFDTKFPGACLLASSSSSAGAAAPASSAGAGAAAPVHGLTPPIGAATAASISSAKPPAALPVHGLTPPIGAAPNYIGSRAWREIPQISGDEGPDDLLVKAAITLNTGAQLLLDLHTPAPRLPTAGAATTVAGRIRGVVGAAAAGVTGTLTAARRALGVPPAGRPQGPAAPAVPKPRLPPPSVAVRAPTRRRLPLTQPPPRRAVPALPISLSAAAAAAVGVSGEEPPLPGWAPSLMEDSLRQKCAAAPIVTDECAQFELDKDIRAVHSFIERHQLRNADPRMQDYIKDISSGKFSAKDLEAKYPDHNVYVRMEGGRPVKMKVTNPYRAKSYRYPLEGSASFAEPAGISDADKPLHKQNLDLLKAIAPASVIADKRFATAILESLWRCSASQDLAGKPACFPARVLGELRLFEKYNDQTTRKQMADDVRVFSEWGMVSDIMRQMIRGDVPPVRMDAARVRDRVASAAAAAEAAAAGAGGAAAASSREVAAEAAAAASSREVAAEATAAAASSSSSAAAAAAPKPPAGPLRPIRRGLAVRAPAQIGALGPRFQHGILPPTTIGAASMVM